MVFTEVYSKIRKHSLNHFWHDSLEKSSWLDLVNEKNFPEPKKPSSIQASTPPAKALDKPSPTPANTRDAETTPKCTNVDMEYTATFTVYDDNSSECELYVSDGGFKLKLEPNDRELFCTGLTFGTQEYIGQRVLQIAQILRNLSFAEENMAILAKNRTFFRFMLLCVGSKWNSISQLGLDMLSNIAGEIIIKNQASRLTDCLVSFICEGLYYQDRGIVIACLEILNKLSQNELNEDYLLRTLDAKTYSQVCSFLTLHDVMLLIYTLECLYSLSSMGERACNYIVDVHGIIDTLVSLVTVEGKSYGPKACIGMKLVETVSGVSSLTQMQTAQPVVAAQTSVPQTMMQSAPQTLKAMPQLQQTLQAQPLRNLISTPQKVNKINLS